MGALPKNNTHKTPASLGLLQPPEEIPSALRSLGQIIADDLCHRCGTCVGLCPHDSLSCNNEGYPIVSQLDTCTNCDLCVKVCPGDEFDATAHAKSIFDQEPDPHDLHAHFEASYLSYASSKDLRDNSASGGFVTALLLSLLEQKIIDGAVVIASDEKELWKGQPIVATSREEIIAAATSKYAISPTNAVLSEVLQTKGKYALVGLPCQIHGFRKAALLHRRLRERVVLTVGLFCHAAVEHRPLELIWESLGSVKEQAVKYVSRVGKHPGTPHLMLANGTMQPVYFPKARGYRPSSTEMLNMMYRFYTPMRCLTCYDATAEYADIAVGDPWMPPPDDEIDFFDGYSFVFARTQSALRLLQAAEEKGDIHLRELSEEAARTCNKAMGEEKRYRAFWIIKFRALFGKVSPVYGFSTPQIPLLLQIKTAMNLLTHVFCFAPRIKDVLFRLLLSPPGYCMLKLNNLRRRVKFFVRDALAKRKRNK